LSVNFRIQTLTVNVPPHARACFAGAYSWLRV